MCLRGNALLPSCHLSIQVTRTAAEVPGRSWEGGRTPDRAAAALPGGTAAAAPALPGSAPAGSRTGRTAGTTGRTRAGGG